MIRSGIPVERRLKGLTMSNDDTKTRDLIHNLRTPISVINGFLKAIKDLSMNEQQREYYEAAVRSGEKIEELTKRHL